MNNEEWKANIQEPYKDAWVILKSIQNCGDKDSDEYMRYMEDVGKFREKYEGNEFANRVRGFLLQAIDPIVHANGGNT